MAKLLILWDIDGTLVTSRTISAHKKSFRLAMKQIFSIDADIDEMEHHGLTDKLILCEMLRKYGIAQDKIDLDLVRCYEAMVAFCSQNQAGDSVIVIPGVKELLKHISNDNTIIQGLLTGNLEQIAHLKMDFVGLGQFFPSGCVGGFGSDPHMARSDLVDIAVKRAEKLHGFQRAPDGRNVIVIGDTPRDVDAAKNASAVSVAVATGVYNCTVLREKQPDVLFENFTQTEAVYESLRKFCAA